MGHGSCGSLARQLNDGLRGSRVKKCDISWRQLGFLFRFGEYFFTNTDYDHLLARQSHAHTAASNPSDVRQPEAGETLWNLYQPPAFIIDTKTEMDRAHSLTYGTFV